MTHAIILAAGKGERLMPLTKNMPKCCIEFNHITLLQYQINNFKKAGIHNVSIVVGHMSHQVLKYGLNTIFNKDYESSNMVKSLFFDASFFQNLDEDLIISYGDIIYEYKNLIKLCSSSSDISIMIDANWLDLWKIRMDNPLSDAESLIMNEKKEIINLGMKAKSYDEIQGQFTGLLKIRKNLIKELRDFYLSLSADTQNKMYMTDYIQSIIDNGIKVNASIVKGGWLEFDTLSDLKIYEKLLSTNKLDNFFKF